MKKGGFTLIEMLVSISVISILAGLLYTGINSARSSSKKKGTEMFISQLHMASQAYRTGNLVGIPAGLYPPTKDDDPTDTSGLVEKLSPAIQLKKENLSPDGKDFIDPWGRKYFAGVFPMYKPDGSPIEWSKRKWIEIGSAGPDGEYGIRNSNGHYVGKKSQDNVNPQRQEGRN